MLTFSDFLIERLSSGGFSTEDTLAALLPLFRQVMATHEAGQVAPLMGIKLLNVQANQIWFAESDRQPPRDHLREVQSTIGTGREAVEVIATDRVTLDGGRVAAVTSTDLAESTQVPERPVFVRGYVCWEQLLDHHDASTDIFCLGQLLASVALGLDLREPDQMETFVRNRRNLFAIREDIHPVIARIITRMTELDRNQRASSLPGLTQALANYRAHGFQASVDPDTIEGFQSRDLRGKRQVLLDRLQARLFEVTRRNPLLQYRSSGQSLDLTQASVPLSFDYSSIREDRILTATGKFIDDLIDGKRIPLERYIDFTEALYAPSALNQIIRQAKKDRAEFGFAQLRLVLCKLNWANLKEQPVERYTSPLLLYPVELNRKKGVRDSWFMEPLGSDAEVNPVIRYLFKEQFGIELPEWIDLRNDGIGAFHTFLASAIQASEPAVELKRIDRPQIRLLHAQARKRLERYQRRARLSGRGIRSYHDIDYSYDPANYHPLGIRLFSRYARRPETELTAVLQTRPRPRQYFAAVAERTFFEMGDSTDNNPYTWTFDLCSVSLANFRYQKMSLVRDYHQLIATQPENAAFESIFSLSPRPAEDSASPPHLGDRFDVVPCDPTQASSIAKARRGGSYIIQGPPGTGKSQTITNLIADFVARGRRVLFVCEKRAAIDVVFARLKQVGLDRLTCLIHDSQADKKSFVMDLRDTYEAWLDKRSSNKSQDELRDRSVASLLEALAPLNQFAEAMTERSWQAGVSNARLIEQVIQLRDDDPRLNEIAKEHLPSWKEWVEHRPSIEATLGALKTTLPSGILAEHPLRRLALDLADDSSPVTTVRHGLVQVRPLLQEVLALSADSLLTGMAPLSLARLDELVAYAQALAPLRQSGNLNLLQADSDASREFAAEQQRLADQQRNVEAAQEINAFWKDRIPERDLPLAMERAAYFQGRWYAFLFPSWWRLRALMNRVYDFSAHTVRPNWGTVLGHLRDEYDAIRKRDDLQQTMAERYNWSAGTASLQVALDALPGMIANQPEWIQALHHRVSAVADQPATAETLARIFGLDELCGRARVLLKSFMTDFESLPVDALLQELDTIDSHIGQVPDFQRCLRTLRELPASIRDTLRTSALPPQQLESAIVARAWELVCRDHPELVEFDQARRQDTLSATGSALESWMESNAEYVCDNVSGRFLAHIHGTAAVTQESLTPEFQKRYAKGRKTLEHEFSKQMRYQSIRDLVSGDSGLVIRDLKPVWLMSPLSVSDTLPLDNSETTEPLFDVVIFDEASQITLESAVPSLFRAHQTIVVGDQQQLPPTSFFQSQRDDADNEIAFEEDGELLTYDLESNSLLNHASRNLPSTLLGWHYRSRNEALISFSNQAFYDGRLMTIPEESLPIRQSQPLNADSAESAVVQASALGDRPISFHFMQHGVYESRKNLAEANYIAELTRQLVSDDSGRTIGIIAFSESQQAAIEDALESLAESDPDFGKRYEAELAREEDGQFVGLLVKNLENIQGDERDIVILSVCYGPDGDGKMRMNFGPINHSGGEKRLNVAFSRAKHHMAIVSSIRHGAVTNTHNSGANCLRNYLRYAESVSLGDRQGASLVLSELAPPRRTADDPSFGRSRVVQAIASRLQAHGFDTDEQIGSSAFRCDIGVRRDGDRKYRLGILVDTVAWYGENPDTLDREFSRPRLLQNFGWRILHVLSSEWYRDPDRITQQIVELCETGDA